MVSIGDVAPSFELYDTDLKIRKSDEFGDKYVISFFVAASSPVCETEMCTFRDKWSKIKDAGAQIIGISNDGPFANKEFATKHNIAYPILADFTRSAINAYGVLMPDLLHIKDYNAAKRSVFVIKDNKIAYSWISDDPLVEPKYEEIFNSLNN